MERDISTGDNLSWGVCGGVPVCRLSVHMSVNMFSHICIHMSWHMSAHMHVHIFWTLMHAYVSTHVSTHVYRSVYMRVHSHMYSQEDEAGEGKARLAQSSTIEQVAQGSGTRRGGGVAGGIG